LRKLEKRGKNIKVVDLVRNFGKEIALTAGLNLCQGEAAILIDADLQHPVEMIPKFLKRWEAGAEVVIGVRKANKGEGFLKKTGSLGFYKILSAISETKIVPSSTDFRLLDRVVIDEFNRFTERNRITRGLIDWLGFPTEYIYFSANQRADGGASYGLIQLVRLAMNSFTSLSLLPLRVAGYLGILITLFSGILGLFMFLEDKVFSDPFHLSFSGTAFLAVLIIFLVGIVLICLGLIALYVANIYTQVNDRPLYVIRRRRGKT
jgi:dolichol-phosphate mannosyltransferase